MKQPLALAPRQCNDETSELNMRFLDLKKKKENARKTLQNQPRAVAYRGRVWGVHTSPPKF